MTTQLTLNLAFDPEPDPSRPTVETIYGRRWPHTVIRASAGSGKTYQLAARYLRLLRHGAAPDAILATTFTRKAAGEIQARVLGWLAEAAVSAKARADLGGAIGDRSLDAARCVAMLRSLADVLHRLPISTIDSFFNRVAGGFRFELGLPPEPKYVDASHPLVAQARLQAIEAMLGDHDLRTMLSLLRRLHHDSAARSVTQAIDDIVCGHYEVYREAPHAEAWTRLRAPKLLDDDALRAALERMCAAADHLPTHKSFVAQYEKACDAALRADWDTFAECGLAKAVAAGEEKYYGKPIPDGVRDAVAPLADHAQAVQVDRVAKQTEATFELLDRFHGHYDRLRRQAGLLLFSDLTHGLARLLPSLGGDVLTDVYYRLDGQLQHLLLDEFQDTSVDQWTVFGPFVGEVSSVADGAKSFFCVGDVKQAIYGWRGGCAELFDHVEALPGLADVPPVSLTKSYRSSQVVLEAVNALFEGLADNPALQGEAAAVDSWACDFDAHEAAKDLPGHVVLCTSPAVPEEAGGDEDEAAITDHEHYAAERVKAIHDAAPWATIGVLVARHKMANLLLYHLRRLGLPASGEGGSPLTDTLAVSTVLSALTLADHPGHTAAAFHVLNSPLGAVLGLRSMHPVETRRVALAVRRSLLSRGYSATLSEWVRALAPSCGARSLSRLMQLVELADRADDGLQALRPTGFVRFVETTSVEEPTPAPIRVMTIHASKGLEFDAVVLPELDHSLRQTPALLIDRESPTGPIRGVYRYAKESVRGQDEALQRAYDRHREAELREDLCNLYVAMTRAKHALHMVVRPLQRKKDGGPSTRGWSNLTFASMLRRGLCGGEPDFDGGETLYERGDDGWTRTKKIETAIATPTVAEPLRLAPKRTTDGERRGLPVATPSRLAHRRTRGGDVLELEGDGGQRYGTLVHAWCEKVGFTGEADVADDELLDLARRNGWEDDGSLRRRIAGFRNAIAKPAVAAALRRPETADEVDLWCERSFAALVKGTLLQGQFDRVVVQRDRTTGRPTCATLIDFKSDAVDGPAVDEAARRYTPQVEAYRDALSTMLGLPPERITAKLIFLHPGEVREIAVQHR